MTDSINLQTYCIVDREPIPEDRAKKRSSTCSGKCNKILAKIRRARTDARRCRKCAKPSTPDERKSYNAWLRSHPEFKTVKIGRPKKKSEAATACEGMPSGDDDRPTMAKSASA